MLIQFGNNPEITVSANYDLTYWALPLAIHWSNFSIRKLKSHNIVIRFLYFDICFEIWKWSNERM